MLTTSRGEDRLDILPLGKLVRQVPHKAATLLTTRSAEDDDDDIMARSTIRKIVANGLREFCTITHSLLACILATKSASRMRLPRAAIKGDKN